MELENDADILAKGKAGIEEEDEGEGEGDDEGEDEEDEDDVEAQAMDLLQKGIEEPVERVKFKSPISAVWTTQGRQALMKGKAVSLKAQLAPPPRPAKIAHRTGVCCFLSLRNAKRPPPCTDRRVLWEEADRQKPARGLV